MSDPTLIESKTSLQRDLIEPGNRLRPVSEAGVAAIVASVREIGQITNPITVRQMRRKGETRWVIIDGAHRLAAAGELGWTDVPVRVFECTDDQARIMEIDGNLAGAELNPLDTAVFLATRKVVYEKLHPETKAGVAGARALHNNCANELSSFAEVTAEKFSMTPRQVQKIVAVGSRLAPEEVARLRTAPRRVTLKDLQDIGQIKEAPQRYDVVDALAQGRAKNAAAAIKALKPASETPVKDPVEEQLRDLKSAWKRAGAAARRRFSDEFGIELARLLGLQLGVVMPTMEAAE